MPGHFPDRVVPWVLPDIRVLVVDDHYTYRMLLGSLLEKLGVAHRCCCDGQQALNALATAHFDLVISDCRMPVMDGYAMTRELRRRELAENRVPIIVLGLTGNLGPEEVRQCVACGMDGWLIKPIGFAQLRDVLHRWLPPEPSADLVECADIRSVRTRLFPTRTSLIDAFGSWDVVEPMLFSLIQEAHADLAVLAQAQTELDATMAAQCLHRLVGSIAFLGETGLEHSTLALINAVHSSGMATNRSTLDAFRRQVEWYLNYLADL